MGEDRDRLENQIAQRDSPVVFVSGSEDLLSVQYIEKAIECDTLALRAVEPAVQRAFARLAEGWRDSAKRARERERGQIQRDFETVARRETGAA
jgi:hypothetical protein